MASHAIVGWKMSDTPGDSGSLPPDAAAKVIGECGRTAQSQLGALPGRVLTWHPAMGEWCVNEVIGHLIEAERRGFAGRIREILRQDRPTFATWDQAGVSQARNDCARDPGKLIKQFAALRAESAELAAGLTAADFERGGVHPVVGFLRVSDLLHEWIHHGANHLRQILANVQAAVWPHMGNAQRFSQPD